MKSNRYLISIITAGLLVACGEKRSKADDPLSDSGRTIRTETLLENLKAQGDSGVYMFGHHDDTVYGIGWEADYTNDSTISERSDVKSICNDLPAVLSFDLGHIELGDDKNLDGVPFDRIKKEIIHQFERGGMSTLSWHLDNPLSGGTAWVADSLKELETKTVSAVLGGGEQHEKFLVWLDQVANFLNTLKTSYGIKVPIVFRPWHEHTGSWFWWGQNHCTTEQYKALWKLTVDRLKDKGVTNALYAYSPGTESGGDESRYLERYPGDEVIDVLGLDTYCFAPEADTTQIASYARQLNQHLTMITKIAKEHNKVMALTETGYEGIKTEDWWTKTLAPILAKHPVSYVVVWRNARERPSHHYAPYPGHPSASDFVKFYNDKQTLFLHDVNGLYLKH